VGGIRDLVIQAALSVIGRTVAAVGFPTFSEDSVSNAAGPIDLANRCAAGRTRTPGHQFDRRETGLRTSGAPVEEDK